MTLYLAIQQRPKKRRHRHARSKVRSVARSAHDTTLYSPALASKASEALLDTTSNTVRMSAANATSPAVATRPTAPTKTIAEIEPWPASTSPGDQPTVQGNDNAERQQASLITASNLAGSQRPANVTNAFATADSGAYETTGSRDHSRGEQHSLPTRPAYEFTNDDSSTTASDTGESQPVEGISRDELISLVKTMLQAASISTSPPRVEPRPPFTAPIPSQRPRGPEPSVETRATLRAMRLAGLG